MQPALSKVLRESDGTNTTHFVHAPRGIHAQYDGTDWMYTAQDALGSVRAAFDATAAIQQSVNYGEYGVPDSSYDGFAFTGEQRDSNGLQYHRARYYDPTLGVWASLDPLETPNRYGYVGGNPVMNIDPTGRQGELPEDFVDCVSSNTVQERVDNCYIQCLSPFIGSGLPELIMRSNCAGKCEERRNASRNKIAVQILEGYSVYSEKLPDFNNLNGVDRFVLLSNTVAFFANDNLQDYLYLMNVLLLGYPQTGQLNNALMVQLLSKTVGKISTRYENNAKIEIDDTGLHCDYRDNSNNQINHHIWAYISSSAGSIVAYAIPPLANLLNRSITDIGILFHDLWEDSDGTWQDVLAGLVGSALGEKLRAGELKPSNFGYAFRELFSLDYCSVMGCTGSWFPDYNGEGAVNYLEETNSGFIGGGKANVPGC